MLGTTGLIQACIVTSGTLVRNLRIIFSNALPSTWHSLCRSQREFAELLGADNDGESDDEADDEVAPAAGTGFVLVAFAPQSAC